MKYTLAAVLTLMSNFLFGQTEKANQRAVTEQFVQHYNDGDYKGIFSMFGTTMQDALPLKKTTKFFEDLTSQVGSIKEREFIKYDNGTYASYKTKFERGVLLLNISIDEKSKINGLFIKPFVESTQPDHVTNNLSAKDSFITQHQTDILFETAKNFPERTQIAIALIKNGKADYYGIIRKDDTISKIDNHKSVFEIGSISKVFTSTLLADLVTAKKIKLKENINPYLETPLKNNARISFIDLANHTSGLPRLPTNIDLSKVNPENPYQAYTEKELQEFLSKQLDLSKKGTYQYSNLGAGLLSHVLSKIENDTYEHLLQKRIFSQYNMINSSTDIARFKNDLVKGLNSQGEEVPNWNFSALAGAGAILSTVEDLSYFAISQFDQTNEAQKLTRKKTFEINDNMAIGLGWHILQSSSDDLWHWHNGGTGGYTSSMVIDEKTRDGVVILSNISAFHPAMEKIDKLCFDLMKTLKEE